MAGKVAQRFGQRMRQRRDELGLTQREVAARMGGAVTKQHISDWERGAVDPTDRYKLQLVEALEVPDVGWFYEAPADDTPNVLAALDGDSPRLMRIEARVNAIYALLTAATSDTAEAEAELAALPDRIAEADAPQKPQGRERPARGKAAGRRKSA